MTLKELSTIRRKWLDVHCPYSLTYWDKFNYKILDNILYRKKAGRGSNDTVNDVIIMADTETSKKHPNDRELHPDGTLGYVQVDNHVVAWTISIRAFERNIVTLYGTRPSDFAKCLTKIIGNMNGYITYIYFHNLAYDWVFLRKFLLEEFGEPENQLNTKPHYPIYIQWHNGLVLKDSLILAQRSLQKWASDLHVEHQKATGKWDYNKIRNQQGESFTADELEYIEHDTLAGVECLDKLRITLNKYIYSMPYTATGIPREEVRKIGSKNGARDLFNRLHLSYEQYIKAEQVYHGGYTHANRHLIDVLIDEPVSCRDFASSYPFVMLSEKYPSESFSMLVNKDIDFILRNSDEYAFMFKLILIKPRLKDNFQPMPALQLSKCVSTINTICDNGRILAANYIEIYITELDLKVISSQYIYEGCICTEVECSKKDYLPRWFTDYIFQLFEDKTKLKGGDHVLYALAKAKLNSLYGMCVQKCIKDEINEDYMTGEYIEAHNDHEGIYEKYLHKRTSILPYQWGVWVTAYAFYNLFQLGKCCETWVYSDTDSCYGIGWDDIKLEAYNNQCKEKLKANGYGCVEYNNREYWLGVAEFDGEYSEFKVMGAKRYCGRSTEDNELHITVAGVPKIGHKCLCNDINNFTKGMIFDGERTGKLTHTYNYIPSIYIDENGNETGDSIDLTPCDYKLNSVTTVDWEALFTEEVQIQVYEEDIKVL